MSAIDPDPQKHWTHDFRGRLRSRLLGMRLRLWEKGHDRGHVWISQEEWRYLNHLIARDMGLIEGPPPRPVGNAKSIQRRL